MKKKLISICLLLILLLVSILETSALERKDSERDLITMESKAVSADGIKVSLNGELLKFDVLPKIINNRTMIPIRAVSEALKSSVEWDGDTRTMIAEKNDIRVSLTVGNDKMSVNGKTVALDSPATVYDNRILVPIRAITEAFGIDVTWDKKNSLVVLREPEYKDVNTVLLYNTENKVIVVPDIDIDRYKARGWMTERQVQLYALDGRTQFVAESEVAANIKEGWYTEPFVIMYAPDGRTQTVNKADVEANIEVGWSTEPFVTMYALDGRTQVVAQNEVAANEQVGWYTKPSVKMYAPDGRTQVVAQDEMEANQAVGWYEYPVTALYNDSGTVLVVPSSEIEAYKAEGWYTEGEYSAKQYVHLAEAAFARIKWEHPGAVANGAYIYPYKDSQGEDCVAIYIQYKILTNWSSSWLYKKDLFIENADDYYQRLADRNFGPKKIAYIQLAIDFIDAQINATKGYSGEKLNAITGYRGNEIDTGYYVDGETLNY